MVIHTCVQRPCRNLLQRLQAYSYSFAASAIPGTSGLRCCLTRRRVSSAHAQRWSSRRRSHAELGRSIIELPAVRLLHCTIHLMVLPYNVWWVKNAKKLQRARLGIEPLSRQRRWRQRYHLAISPSGLHCPPRHPSCTACASTEGRAAEEERGGGPSPRRLRPLRFGAPVMRRDASSAEVHAACFLRPCQRAAAVWHCLHSCVGHA